MTNGVPDPDVVEPVRQSIQGLYSILFSIQEQKNTECRCRSCHLSPASGVLGPGKSTESIYYRHGLPVKGHLLPIGMGPVPPARVPGLRWLMKSTSTSRSVADSDGNKLHGVLG